VAQNHADSKDLRFGVLEVEVAVVLFIKIAKHEFVDLMHDKARVGELPDTILIKEEEH
jgi:hypothetical protein